MLFRYTRIPMGIEITGFLPGEKVKHLVLPEEIDGLPVVSVGEEAFWGCGIESVEAPSVRRVMPCAFRDCRALRRIALPQATEILGFALAGCGALEEIDLPMIRVLGPGVFEATGLREASFGSLAQVGAYCFSKCRKLKSLVFEDGCTITAIPRNLVADCNALTTLVYPTERVCTIGKHAFRATRLEEIDLSSPAITRLDWNVAYDCRRLVSFRFPPHISYETTKHDFFSLQDFSQSPNVKIHLPIEAKGVYLKGVKDEQIVYYGE